MFASAHSRDPFFSRGVPSLSSQRLRHKRTSWPSEKHENGMALTEIQRNYWRKIHICKIYVTHICILYAVLHL